MCAESRNPCIGWLLNRNKTYGVETAEDIFTDAVLILWQNAQQGRIKPSDTQVQTYLMTTCRYIQNNQIRKTPMEADFDKLLTELADQNPDERLMVGNIKTNHSQVHLNEDNVGMYLAS